MKMGNMRMLFVGILISVAFTDAYRFSRLEGIKRLTIDLLPSFTDADYPPDDHIDDTDAVNIAGTNQLLGFDFNVFDYVTDEVKIFDAGYILLRPSEDYLERTGESNFFILPEYPVVAPNWMESNLQAYHVAWRLVNESMAHRQHDLDRINKEVNQFQTWYPETWKATHALIVTWKIGDVTGAFNKFQAVLTSGVNSNNGDTEMYVLFLYEENFVPSQHGHISAVVNGFYDGAGAAVNLADLCGEDNIPIHLYSNYKCGTKGIYLFKMKAGTECHLAFGECEESYDNPQCMVPFHEPQDTCTETVYCLMNEEGTQVTMNFYFKHYVYDHLSALDYEIFKGTGTDAEPEGVQMFIDDCQTTLANGGSAAAEDTFEFDVNIDPVDATPPCGTVVDTAEHSIAYALTVYDPNNPDVDLDGKFIICGKCFYQDLPRQVTQSVLFNDISVTDVSRSPRYLSMKWIDRPTAIDGLELLSVKQGRDMWLMVSFITGSPFVQEVDPFGARVDHCRISNNENFHEYSDDQIGDPDDRAEDIFIAGCVEQPGDKSFYFENGFTVDPDFDTLGGEWRIVAGKMEAVAFNTPSKKLWTMCTTRFCTRTTNTFCHSTCTVGGRTRRSVEVNTTATGTETLIVELDIEQDDESQQPTGEQVSADDDCVSQTTAIVTIVILIVITMIALAAAIAIFMMLQKRNKLRRKI